MQENIPIEEIFDNLKCKKEGLSSEQVQQRLDLFGYNKLEEKMVKSQTSMLLVSYFLSKLLLNQPPKEKQVQGKSNRPDQPTKMKWSLRNKSSIISNKSFSSLVNLPRAIVIVILLFNYFNLVLSNHNSKKFTSAQNYLVAITPILRTQIK